MSWEDFLQSIRAEFPDFSLRTKRDSYFMKLIDLFLRAVTLNQMNDFLTFFVTTIGCTVYVPDMWESMTPVDRMIVLRHERVHMRQRRRYGAFLFSFLYLFFPLPGGCAYFRKKFEQEAYEETIAATVELKESGAVIVQTPAYRSWVLSYFMTSAYFWMWPFRKDLEAWYDAAVERILAAAKKA